MMTRHEQQGFSLVELMIAMTLGLIVTGAILKTFIANSQSMELQRAAVGLQEEGRATIDYITRYVRMAGFRETSLEEGSLSDGLSGAASSISIKFKAAASNATGSTDNPKPIAVLRDCLGTMVSNAAESVNLFQQVGNELVCQATINGGSAASAALISNVQELRILYGVDSDGDGIANQYKTTTGSDDVVLLKVCLRLRGGADIVSPAATYKMCDGSDDGTPSQKLERRIETTIALRNRVGS
ncbi:PilW family protein [Motiliproteus sediminis]|uniref:PilW family protein n=1 Tax=Motiliproteus sediminis TaxID=1468178 RepID=UPI001AEFB998|nr:PilW family protein [Motiliproteus sediminis]